MSDEGDGIKGEEWWCEGDGSNGVRSDGVRMMEVMGEEWWCEGDGSNGVRSGGVRMMEVMG